MRKTKRRLFLFETARWRSRFISTRKANLVDLHPGRRGRFSLWTKPQEKRRFLPIHLLNVHNKRGKDRGAEVAYVIKEVPAPLRVKIPKVPEVLIVHDPLIKESSDRFTDGGYRTLIYTIQGEEHVDKLGQTIVELGEEAERKRQQKLGITIAAIKLPISSDR